MKEKKPIIKNKHIIQIPSNIKIIYCTKTKILVFLSPLAKKTLKVPVKICLFPNIIVVTKISNYKISKNYFKNLKKIQGTTIAKIKLLLIEITNILYKKLILIGVGYRAFNIENLSNQINLKLGYSHLIYHKISSELQTFNLKTTKLFIFGLTSYDNLTQVTASIRQCKPPEPYKGKGILYYQEKIKLKKGKKI